MGGVPAVSGAPHQLGGTPGAPPAAAVAPATAPAGTGVPVSANGQAPGQHMGGGVNDYSQQWIEYYRSQGMHAEADKIEQQLKAAKVSTGYTLPNHPSTQIIHRPLYRLTVRPFLSC